MSRLRLFVSSHGVDALIVATAVVSAVGTALRQDPDRPNGLVLWFQVLAMATVVLPMLARRRAPFAAPASTWLLGAGLSFLDGQLIVGQPGMFIAGIGAALLLGNLRSSRQARLGLVIVIGGTLVIAYNDPTHTVGDFFFLPVQFVIGWVVGFALREHAEEAEAAELRATQAERDRKAAARIAVAEERARIARELHDVVAHAVSVMVLQVGAVRHRMPPANTADRAALTSVEQAGRTALTEMRRLLDAMRHDGEELELVPHPGLQNLESLMEDVQAAGLDVRLRVRGEPVELPPTLDLSAYRILQEGLTNTLKHAHASTAYVDVCYDRGQLRLEVRDDGRGPTPHGRPGHGLVGIGERVKIYAGDMSAGPCEAGGFVLRARLPVNGP